jgi:hypothetical protein
MREALVAVDLVGPELREAGKCHSGVRENTNPQPVGAGAAQGPRRHLQGMNPRWLKPSAVPGSLKEEEAMEPRAPLKD